MKDKIFSFILLLIIIVKFIAITLSIDVEQLDFANLQNLWLHSQYNLNQGYEFYGNMSDEDLRTYAALEYIRGKDPSMVNFEDPPLAKYLFGFSYLLFKNMIYFQIAVAVCILIITFLICKALTISTNFSLVSSLMLVFDKLFQERISNVNLDLIQLLFTLVALYLFLFKVLNRKNLILLGISVGVVLSTKVFLIGFMFLLFICLMIFFKRLGSSIKKVISICLISLSVYLCSYVVFFYYHSFVDFVNLHFNIMRLYLSYLPEYPWFEIWRIFFLGKWRTWFADPNIQPVADYWIIWPISFFTSLSLLFIKKNWDKWFQSEKIILYWGLIYLIFQSTHVVFPRYILLIIPCFYILTVYRFMIFIKIKR